MSSALRQLVIAAAALWASGCALDERTAICELARDDVRVFPVDGSSGLAVNVQPRVLIDEGRAADVDVVLVEQATASIVPATVRETITSFGTVLEVVPDFDLLPQSAFTVEIVDRGSGVVELSSRFETGSFSELGPPTELGEVSIGAISRDDRSCCGASGCRDGTGITTPALVGDSFLPHLVLLEIEEVFNDTCGPTAQRVGMVPVIHETSVASELVAETDVVLRGCFRVQVRDQLGRTVEPDGVVCTEGYVWEPSRPSQSCHRTHGCQGAAGPPPSSLWLLLLLLVATRPTRR